MGGCECHSPLLEPVRPGLNSKVLGSCLEPRLPWGQCQPKPTVTSGITFQKLVFERDKLGPRGLYLCVLVLGRRRKEKRRRRGSGSERQAAKAIREEREIALCWVSLGAQAERTLMGPLVQSSGSWFDFIRWQLYPQHLQSHHFPL